MSIILWCDKVDLIRTPTYITYMCYSNRDGGWKGIKYRYEQYCRMVTQDLFNNHKIDRYDWLKEHLEELNSHKTLKFEIQ